MSLEPSTTTVFAKPRPRLPWRTTVLAVALAGCGIFGIGGYDGEVTWEVAPAKVTCFGPFETTCLQVREPGATAYENFYGSIDRFDYQEGFRYLIRVGWHEIDPVPDGPSRRYRLIRLIEKEPVPIP